MDYWAVQWRWVDEPNSEWRIWRSSGLPVMYEDIDRAMAYTKVFRDKYTEIRVAKVRLVEEA